MGVKAHPAPSKSELEMHKQVEDTDLRGLKSTPNQGDQRRRAHHNSSSGAQHLYVPGVREAANTQQKTNKTPRALGSGEPRAISPVYSHSDSHSKLPTLLNLNATHFDYNRMAQLYKILENIAKSTTFMQILKASLESITEIINCT